MITVPPLTITDAILTTDAVAEPFAPAAYSGATTYGLGDIRTFGALTYQSRVAGNIGNQPDISPTFWEQIGFKEVTWTSGATFAAGDYSILMHRVYQSLAAANTGNDPRNSPLKWQDVGPTNKWAMFDNTRNSPTVAASPLVIEISPGVRVDTLGVGGCLCDTVQVQVYAADTSLIYDVTKTLITYSSIFDWYSYFTASFIQRDGVLFEGLPPITSNKIRITFTRASGNVEVSNLAIGKAIELGAIQYGATDDATNFSTITRDSFGNASLNQKRSVPKTLQTVWADHSLLRGIRASRDLLNAVPALWAGVEDDANPLFDSVLIFGIYKQYSINLSYTDKVVVTLELEGI